MKTKTQDLTGIALDYAVALADNHDAGWLRRQLANPNPHARAIPAYATDWAHGGPIIEREEVELYRPVDLAEWQAAISVPGEDEAIVEYGPTPLIAAMRCYVASKMGDEIEVPDNFLGA